MPEAAMEQNAAYGSKSYTVTDISDNTYEMVEPEVSHSTLPDEKIDKTIHNRRNPFLTAFTCTTLTIIAVLALITAVMAAILSAVVVKDSSQDIQILHLQLNNSNEALITKVNNSNELIKNLQQELLSLKTGFILIQNGKFSILAGCLKINIDLVSRFIVNTIMFC